MPIVAVNGGGNTPQGVNDGDVDGRDFLVWQRQYGLPKPGVFRMKPATPFCSAMWMQP